MKLHQDCYSHKKIGKVYVKELQKTGSQVGKKPPLYMIAGTRDLQCQLETQLIFPNCIQFFNITPKIGPPVATERTVNLIKPIFPEVIFSIFFFQNIDRYI